MLTLTEAAEQIRTRKLSPVELTRECLARIERLDPVLNAFITVTAETALEQARQAESDVSSGNYRGPLHGLPIALKDLLDTAGVPTTAASNQYRERIPTEDAEVVRWLKQAGAVLIGKTNMHEFAFGMSGVVSAFGATKNPWDTTRMSGGSSSGSAAAVAAGMCVAALGSDTSGSIRCPPALCGIVGHRPSAKLISTKGVVPLCTSFDTIGPMTRSVRDAALLMDVLAPPSSFASLLEEDVSELRVGIARKMFFDDLEPGVARCMEEAVKTIAGLVSSTRDIEVPTQNFRTIFDAEIYEYHQSMFEHSPELYDPRTLIRVKNTAGISATDYIRTWKELRAFRANAEQIFHSVDVVITPATPVPAPKLADYNALPIEELRPFEMKYLMRNTLPFSSLFWPSISVPCGFTSEGLPVGMQLSSRPHADAWALHLAYVYEQATNWRERTPALE